MTHLADAVATLIRQQTMRIHYLPGDPDRAYTVRAPSLLTQLADLTASSTSGAGGRTVPGSRLPIAVDAWQLWSDLTATVHAWAQQLGVNRRPYLVAETDRQIRAAVEREPDWLRTLRPWLRPVAWDQPLDIPVAGPRLLVDDQAAAGELVALPLESPGFIDPTLPPVGRLLRTAAAAAARPGHDLVADTIGRRASCGQDVAPVDCRGGCWAHRIQGLLQAAVEDRAVRGAACWQCTTLDAAGVAQPTRTVVEQRPDGPYRVPAIVIRVAVLPDAGPDDLWVYRMCRACGAEGWLDYSTDTGFGARQDDPDPAAVRRGELRTAAVAARRELEATRYGPGGFPAVLAGATTIDHDKLRKGAA